MSSPTKLGRYQIESFLGKGSFAEVYKATDTILKRVVALKVLKPALMADEEAFARFTHEAQVLAGLDHPRIAWVWDMGEADGRYFIAMRYVEGRSLDKVIAEHGQLTWDETILITSQICEALQYAHDKGLVHRDVKPQNILIHEKNGVMSGAVLTDFGLVKAMLSSGMTTTGSFMGTPNYMASELWEGKDASQASDQYALACVMVEMLTGKILFDGKTPPAVMAKHFQPPLLPPDLPPHVHSALVCALGIRTEDRYKNIQDFVGSLNKPVEDPHVITPVKEFNLEKPAVRHQKRKSSKAKSVITLQKNEMTLKLTNDLELDFVQIPAGEFIMGSDDGDLSNEKPQHTIFLPEFWMGKTSVTNAQYKKFLNANENYVAPIHWIKKRRNYPVGLDDHPVVNVSWLDAQAFCEWAGCRLPTEAEWEKAARGTDGRKYPWGDHKPNLGSCNFNGNKGGTTAVGSFSPESDSPFGCQDMFGNVWEWTSSSYKKYPYRENDGREDLAKSGGLVMRGGSWRDLENIICTVYRNQSGPSFYYDDVGFRCCLIPVVNGRQNP